MFLKHSKACSKYKSNTNVKILGAWRNGKVEAMTKLQANDISVP